MIKKLEHVKLASNVFDDWTIIDSDVKQLEQKKLQYIEKIRACARRCGTCETVARERHQSL